MKRDRLCRKGLHDDWIRRGIKREHYVCRPCSKATDKIWRDNHPRIGYNKAWRATHSVQLAAAKKSYWQATGKNNALQKIYGITLEEYNGLLESQDGGCAICGRKPTGKALHVDHNHKNGDVRGLVCWGCNGMLGKLRDNPDTAEKMAKYLRQDPFKKGSAVLGPSHKRKRRRKRRPK